MFVHDTNEIPNKQAKLTPLLASSPPLPSYVLRVCVQLRHGFVEARWVPNYYNYYSPTHGQPDHFMHVHDVAK